MEQELENKNKAAFCPHCQQMTFVADYTDREDNRKEIDAICFDRMRFGYTIKDISNEDVKNFPLGHKEDCFFKFNPIDGVQNPITHEEWEGDDDDWDDDDDDGDDYYCGEDDYDLESFLPHIPHIHRENILDVLDEIAYKTSPQELINFLENHLNNLKNERKTRSGNQGR